MAKSQQTFNKKEKEKNRLKKQKEKAQKREERKGNTKDSSLEGMMAYVDENGNLVDTPPDPTKKVKIKAENIEIAVPRTENVEFDPVRKGVVEFFNDAKGFGFIKDTDTKEKYFVHINSVDGGELKENNMVTFEIEQGPKGMNAVRVKKA